MATLCNLEGGSIVLKKFVSFLMAFYMLIFCMLNVYAAKPMAQKVIEDKSLKLLLATISDVSDEYITCEVFDRVKYPTSNVGEKSQTRTDGNFSNTTVNIKKFKYSYCEEHSNSYNTPKIGDNICVAVQSDGDNYKLSGCAYKVDTVDVKTLNFLVPAPMKGQSCVYDVTAISYFVAANGMPVEFRFEENIISVKHKDNTAQIYPQADADLPLKYIDSAGRVVEGAVEAKDVINYDDTTAPNNTNFVLNQFNTQNNAWMISALIIVLGVAVGIILALIFRTARFKNKRKGM